MSLSFPQLLPGQSLGASAANDLTRAVTAMRAAGYGDRAAPPGTDGLPPIDAGAGAIWARLKGRTTSAGAELPNTGGGSDPYPKFAYSWAEVNDSNAPGQFPDVHPADGRRGWVDLNPAYAANVQTAIPAGPVVMLTPTADGRGYLFSPGGGTTDVFPALATPLLDEADQHVVGMYTIQEAEAYEATEGGEKKYRVKSGGKSGPAVRMNTVEELARPPIQAGAGVWARPSPTLSGHYEITPWGSQNRLGVQMMSGATFQQRQDPDDSSKKLAVLVTYFSYHDFAACDFCITPQPVGGS